MFTWVNAHGLEMMVAGWIYTTIVSSLPPLPASAGFWSQWAYSFLHLSAGNLRAVLEKKTQLAAPGQLTLGPQGEGKP